MDKLEMGIKLMKCFPGSFINYNGEFIAHKKGEYFILRNCETELDIKCKVIEWFSRGAHKTAPYRSAKSNDEFHRFMLDGVNKFLGTSFTFDDMDLVYTYLGNACNHKLTVQFVESGYDMNLLREHDRRRRAEYV